MKYTGDDLVLVYNCIAQNPQITYEELSKLFPAKKVNINSLVKRLQRMGCISVERDIDSLTGKIKGTIKRCLKSP